MFRNGIMFWIFWPIILVIGAVGSLAHFSKVSWSLDGMGSLFTGIACLTLTSMIGWGMGMRIHDNLTGDNEGWE